MRMQRRRFIVSGIALLPMAGQLGVLQVAAGAHAQQPAGVSGPSRASAEVMLASTSVPDWEPTGLTRGVARVLAPASGALFAVLGDRAVETGLVRSDDAGVTWADVPLPPQTGIGTPSINGVNSLQRLVPRERGSGRSRASR